MKRIASNMFTLYHKVLVENQVDDTVKSRLSILMFDLKDNCTNTIIVTHRKDREHKTIRLQGKATYKVFLDERL